MRPRHRGKAASRSSLCAGTARRAPRHRGKAAGQTASRAHAIVGKRRRTHAIGASACAGRRCGFPRRKRERTAAPFDHGRRGGPQRAVKAPKAETALRKAHQRRSPLPAQFPLRSSVRRPTHQGPPLVGAGRVGAPGAFVNAAGASFPARMATRPGAARAL